jgi:hypothetical protein
MAQAVYSVNIVGYVNLTLAPGFSLIANQLNATPNNQLGSVFPTAPADAQVLTFANGNYQTYITDGAVWYDYVTGDPTTATVSPGQGLFFFNPGATPVTVTTVGEVKTGVGTVPIPPGFSLIASVVPQAVSLTPAFSFTPVPDMQVQKYTGLPPDYYSTVIWDGSAWLDYVTGNPATADLAVGQGAFVFNPEGVAHDWVRNFTP